MMWIHTNRGTSKAKTIHSRVDCSAMHRTNARIKPLSAAMVLLRGLPVCRWCAGSHRRKPPPNGAINGRLGFPRPLREPKLGWGFFRHSQGCSCGVDG